jgi:tetratricopeptide (TPR) repeat protein/mono/diheme cytochrome c family protein
MMRICSSRGGTHVLCDAACPWGVALLLFAGSAQAAQGRVTYTEGIASILDAHCASCHRPGGIGPFSLLDYESARERAARIADVTMRRLMPPWKPVAPVGAFVGERRLTDAQIDLIRRWVADGAPEGPPVPSAAQVQSWDGWQLGRPDLVVSLEAYTLPAEATDVYRKFVLPVPLTELRWVRAVEIRPGPSGAIHHARLMLDATGRARDLDAADPLPGFDGFMADSAEFPRGHVLGWAPGRTPTAHPDSLSWPLRPGTDFVLQLHMLPRAEPVLVRPEIGLYFAGSAATLEPAAVVLSSLTIDIPAGVSAQVVRESYRLPVDVDVLAVYPHAHYLARQVEATATLPDGRRQILIRIDDWDYHWQDEYRYASSVHLPADTRIDMRYVYDNSAANPHNPHQPPQAVRFGPKATDEMAQLMLQVLTTRPADREALIKHLRLRAARDEIVGYQSRLRRDANDHESRTALAVRYLEVGQLDAAFTQLHDAIRLAPQYPDAYYNLAAAHLARGETKEAMGAYQRAIELDPNHAEAHNNLAVLLENNGDRTSALIHYRRAVELRPHHALARHNLANVYLSMGRAEEAASHYRHVIARDPTNLDARAKLARALTQLGQRAEAVTEYRRARSIDPDLRSGLLDFAWLLATAPEPQLRNPAEAIALARRAEAIVGADHPLVLDTLAAAYAADGQFERAVETARQAVARARASADLLVASRAGQIEARVRLYQARTPYRMP